MKTTKSKIAKSALPKSSISCSLSLDEASDFGTKLLRSIILIFGSMTYASV